MGDKTRLVWTPEALGRVTAATERLGRACGTMADITPFASRVPEAWFRATRMVAALPPFASLWVRGRSRWEFRVRGPVGRKPPLGELSLGCLVLLCDIPAWRPVGYRSGLNPWPAVRAWLVRRLATGAT